MKKLFGLALLIFLITFFNLFIQDDFLVFLQSALIAILLVVVAYKIEKAEDKKTQ